MGITQPAASGQQKRRRKSWRRVLLALVLVCASVAIAFQVSPWPGVLLVRWQFSRWGGATARAMEAHVPPGIRFERDLAYDPSDPDAVLDIVLPTADSPSESVHPVVVWVHGGAFVAGSKEDVAPYLGVLAGRGFGCVAVAYTRAPTASYPTPVRQVLKALDWVKRRGAEHGIRSDGYVLAGDSAGAHIAAQVALSLADSSYASALGVALPVGLGPPSSVALFCGPYDLESVDLDGGFGGFLRTVLWAYLGSKDVRSAPGAATFSVLRHVGPAFPRTFLSVGASDPLAAQSYAMAAALRGYGVNVHELFFDSEKSPGLGHEYQFNLDTAEGRQALEALTAFLMGP